MLRDYLQDNILITDGAMGTYYGKKMGGASTLSELANITNPQVIKAIHQEYIQAGAKLVRTNTFSANTVTLSLRQAQLPPLIQAGFKLAQAAAQEASDEEIYVAASIGPIPDNHLEHEDPNYQIIFDQYKHIVDIFLDLGADTFIFETLSGLEDLRPILAYIKNQNPTAFILTQFAMALEGSTRKGLTIKELTQQIQATNTIDAFGFNCGVGPTHLVKLIKDITPITQVVSALPNAGYPQIVNERTVYHENPQYFADVMQELATYGVKILGGCCGTTPSYIEALAHRLSASVPHKPSIKPSKKQSSKVQRAKSNLFRDKITNRQFTIAVELDPPVTGAVAPILRAARRLQQAGVDGITIADSPLGRARMDSLVLAAKIEREIGITTIPHLCCRDKNIIATKASLLGAHMEGIRNILAVTGDPIASGDRSEIKSVFNLNSFSLMKLIGQLNQGDFPQDPFFLGGALDLNVVNADSQIARMERKVHNGAAFFFTQPIFEEESIDVIRKIKASLHTPILAGIMPLVSLNNALFIHNEVPGINVPSTYLERFKPKMDRETASQVGLNIAFELACKLKPVVDGFYLIAPFNRADLITTLLHQLSA